MIAGGFESLAALGECGVELVGTLDGGAEHRRTKAMEAAACGGDDEKALRGEKCRVKAGEGLGECAAGLVGGNERVSSFRGTEQLGGTLDERCDRVIEDDAAGGQCGFGSLFVSKLRQLAARGKRDVVNLGEIVVLAGKPENGGVRMAGSCGLARASDSGSGFEGGIERTAEETHLLAG